MRAGIALGSNLGARREHLRSARNEILRRPGVKGPFLFSPIYETEPVDCEAGAETFLNAVIELEWEETAGDLWRELSIIEASFGRTRTGVRNLSRTIDLDLLYLGDLQIESSGLRLPHPRLHLRRFVLAPLADIRPDLRLPTQTKTVSELLRELQKPEQVVRLMEEW